MWSGPRNISTAMMRSWGNRDDCVVVDEPLYAHYLSVTRKPHPGADEVIAAGETDWRKVVATLTGPVPGGKRIYYQKHMTHHLLPDVDCAWLGQLANCFLIRHPREVLASYAKIVETPTLEDTGFPQQADIFDSVRNQTGHAPPVLDAADVLRNPRRLLGLLCDVLGIDFQDSMLSWPPGPRSTDGVWAKHWYAEVEKSTGFRPYHPKLIELPPSLEAIYSACLEHYELLYQVRLH
jgi:Sulfotransferase domain